MAEAVAGTLGISPSEALGALAAAKAFLEEKKRQERLLDQARRERMPQYFIGNV